MSLTLRAATAEDADFIFFLRNDPMVRAVSLNTGEITQEHHEAFIARWLSPFPGNALYVVESDGERVGTGRIERAYTALSLNMDNCLLGYSLCPQWRGKGLGVGLVKLLVHEGRGMGYAKTVCRIKRENFTSIICAMRGGVDCIELF